MIAGPSRDELCELSGALCNGSITPEERLRLDSLLSGSRDAREFYIKYLDLHLALADLDLLDLSGSDAVLPGLLIGLDAYNGNEGIFSSAALSDEVSPMSPSPGFGFLANTFRGTLGMFSSSGWPTAYLIAFVILGLGLWIGSVMSVRPVHVADNSPSVLLDPTALVVARVTALVDCQRSDSSETDPFPIAVPLGRKFELPSGLMEITYNTGAKVILQGPCIYEVDSQAGGRLSVGKLVARMEKRGEGRGERGEEAANSKSLIPSPSLPTTHYPLFTVTTPTAIVTDLGTEFGVDVNEEGATATHVFRGTVKVQAVSAKADAEGASQILTEDESACVEINKDGAYLVHKPSAPLADFVRVIPKKTVRKLDLVDIVAGGNGVGKARDRGIDPTSGKTATQQPLDLRLASDGRYHAVDELPFIDGVFIPCPAKGPVQLDSAGHVFADAPQTTGESWGHVWAGGQVPDQPGRTLPTTLARGLDYSTAWHSLLAMQSNKGITFDLAAIRRANPRCKLVGFSSIAGRTFLQDAGKADIWVFVDGQLQFRRERFTSNDGEIKITVPLDNRKQFLTLVVTDGGDEVSYDTVIFGDPVLILDEYTHDIR